MCGIAGVVRRGRPEGELRAIADRMTATLRHRGPDDRGLYADAEVALGVQRLAIIDVANGHQPMTSEDGTTWVVQNGEIYNHASLRRELTAAGHRFATASDTEVLVHGWEEWGEALLPRLDGMFAFAVWEQEARRLFLARDRFGIKPLYWAATDDAVVFGSELRAVEASGLVERRLDLVSWGQYLLYEHVPAPRTMWADVRKLEAGSVLEVVDGRVRAPRRWWSLCFEPDRSGSYADRVEELRAAVRTAVQRELVSDVPVGVLLSGGIDSSAVAASAVAARPGVATFTVRFDDPSFDESEHAGRVARHLGTEHHVAPLTVHDLDEIVVPVLAGQDEPIADSSLVPTALLARSVARHVKVALGGDGGDELWAGYPTHLAHRAGGLYRRLPAWVRHRVVLPSVRALPTSFDNISIDFRLKRFVTGAELRPELQNSQWLGGYTATQIRDVVEPEVAELLPDDVLFDPVLRTLGRLGDVEPMDRILTLDAELYLQGILTKVDRASMACSLEVRVPLLNSAVVDVARHVPFEWKLRGRTGKAILKDAAAPWLPPTVVRRGKKGFNVPVAKWLRGPQSQLLDETVSGLPAHVRPDVVRNLVDEHRRGSADHRKLLWPLVVDGLWSRGGAAVGGR